MKASVTLGLVFGAALFAVQPVAAGAAISTDTLNSALNFNWSQNSSTSAFPEPAANADGTRSYNPFDSSSMQVANASILSGNDLGWGISLKSDSLVYPAKSYATQTVDLSKSFTQKSNVYFGSKDAGDGVSFVMTSNSAAFDATSSVFAGSSVGIWGFSTSDGGSPAETAIKNSFAIVMDTHADQGYGTQTSMQSDMDTDVNYTGSSSKQYVGYGYPDQSSMYKKSKANSAVYDLNFGNTSNSGYATGGNYDLVKNTLNNGGWHQLTVNWMPDATGGGKLTYKLTIRDTSGAVVQTISKTVTWSKADVTAIFGTDTSKVFLGYIGSGSSMSTIGAGSQAPQAVTFQQVGTTDVSLSSHLVDINTGAQVTSAQLDQSYVQTYEITMAKDSPDWPSDDSKMSAILQTSKNYSFVKNSDGKVDVAIGLNVYEATYIDAQHIKIEDIDPITAKSVNKGDGSSSQTTDNLIQVEVKATDTDKSLEGKSTVTIMMGTGDTIRQAGTVLPVPQAQKVTNIPIPTFTFGSFSIAQFMTGFTDEGTATTSKDNQLAVTTDGNTSNVKMTVALEPFTDLAPNYTGGKVKLKFSFGGEGKGKDVELTDNGAEQQLFSETSIPDTSVGKTPVITIGKLPNVTTGQKSANLDWTVAVTPPVTAATK